jgi:hypothetical protein
MFAFFLLRCTQGFALDVNSVCGPVLSNPGGYTQDVLTYCTAAQSAEQAKTVHIDLTAIWSSVSAVCLTACALSFTPLGAIPALQYGCMAFDGAAAITDAVLTKQYTDLIINALGLVMAAGANNFTKSPSAEAVSGEKQPLMQDASSSTASSEKQTMSSRLKSAASSAFKPTGAKDISSCVIGALAGMSIWMSAQGIQTEKATEQTNLESAQQLLSKSSSGAVSLPSASNSYASSVSTDSTAPLSFSSSGLLNQSQSQSASSSCSASSASAMAVCAARAVPGLAAVQTPAFQNAYKTATGQDFSSIAQAASPSSGSLSAEMTKGIAENLGQDVASQMAKKLDALQKSFYAAQAASSVYAGSSKGKKAADDPLSALTKSLSAFQQKKDTPEKIAESKNIAFSGVGGEKQGPLNFFASKETLFDRVTHAMQRTYRD